MSDTQKSNEPEFDHWTSYSAFAYAVSTTSRFFWSASVRQFLETVSHTMGQRERVLTANRVFYRAQLGWERDFEDRDDGRVEEPIPYSRERMKPNAESARGGRANAPGIPVLYLAGELNTAIAEVRPWIGSAVSIAEFKTTRKLRTLDLTPGFEKRFFPGFSPKEGEFMPVDAADKERAVWMAIDNAFSRPVSLDDHPTAYIPTQILSEMFRREGIEALVYRSKLSENGHNVVLFNLDDADPITFCCYDVEAVSIKERQLGTPFSST